MALHFESSSPQTHNNGLKTAIFALKKEPTVEDGPNKFNFGMVQFWVAAFSPEAKGMAKLQKRCNHPQILRI